MTHEVKTVTQCFAAAVAGGALATFTIYLQPVANVRQIEAHATLVSQADDWPYVTDVYSPTIGGILCNQTTGYHALAPMKTVLSCPINVAGQWTIVVRALDANGVMAPWTATTAIPYQIQLRLTFIHD